MPQDSKEFDIRTTISDNKLKSLWRLMDGYQLFYILAAFCLGLAAAFRSGTYLILGRFIDALVSENEIGNYIPWIAVSFIGLAAFQGLFTYISGRLAAKTSEGITRRLRNFLFDHIQRLSFTYHDKTKTGELIQRTTSDVDAVRLFFADRLINLGRITLLFIVNLAVLLYLNVRLALLSILVVPLTIVLSLVFFQKVSKAYEEYQDQEAILSNTLQENLTGVRVVKAFARQDFEEEKFEKENQEKYSKGIKFFTMHALFWPFSDILTGAQMLFGYYLGASMAINGEISIGTYLAYAGLIIWIIWPIRNLGRLIVQMSSGLVSHGRILDVIKEQREPLSSGEYSPTSDSAKGELIFKDVSFAYENHPVVLSNINFACSPGKMIALLGGPGSGKSTLINLLPRFYDYTGGLLTLDGIDLKSYPRAYLRKQIGMVEQEPFLFSRSIRENITYGVDREVSDDELFEASKAAAIHDVIINFSQGYDTIVGEKGVTLSGGQKQRIAIARTVLMNPKILILDDATSSVDVETEAQIHQALERLMVGRTTFIIAHRIQSLMQADLILVLDHGEIIQQGIHKNLIKQSGKYKEIFDIQTKIDSALIEEIDLVQ
ncbi:MAG: ABC transporter ATP-binding protein/permease [Anaerolineales bacterium]|nr:ABC transporter ATP-binding protein/permease [Anaerolineales bacterium]